RTRVFSSTNGCSCAGVKRACSMRAPYLPSLTIRVAPLLEKPLPSVRCQPLSIDGSGSQTWVAPRAGSMSTRVVTSKVRQPSCGRGSKTRCGGESAALAVLDRTKEGIAAARGKADERLRKSRLEFMKKSPVWVEQGSLAWKGAHERPCRTGRGPRAEGALCLVARPNAERSNCLNRSNRSSNQTARRCQQIAKQARCPHADQTRQDEAVVDHIL